MFQQGDHGGRMPPPPLDTIAQTRKRLVDELAFLDDWSDRYQTLIEIGRRLPPMSETLKTARNRIRNCQGDAWLAAEWRSGHMCLSAASDSGFAAGVLALFVALYSGHTLEDISAQPLMGLEALGLAEHLSPHRRAAYQEIQSHFRELLRRTRDFA